MLLKYWSKHRSTITYGLSLAGLLLLMKQLEWRFLVISNAFELYAGCIAMIFMVLGIWLTLKLNKPKANIVTIEKVVQLNGSAFVLNELAVTKTGISKRELQVLNLMARGFSNDEIAEQLFVSLNTVKTHSSKIFEKLEVRRRTEAIAKAKNLGIIA